MRPIFSYVSHGAVTKFADETDSGMNRNEHNDLIVFFNVYCWSKVSPSDALDMETLLVAEFDTYENSAEFGSSVADKKSRHFPGITVDLTEIEVKGWPKPTSWTQFRAHERT